MEKLTRIHRKVRDGINDNIKLYMAIEGFMMSYKIQNLV